MADDISSGTLLIAGRYELYEALGRGGMGTVYRGRDVVLDRPVAVKLLPTSGTDPAQTARFEREARLLARFSHPGLVVVFDAGVEDEASDEPKRYLVMELVPGPTLADRLRHGPLPPTEVASLAAQLSAALAYIHRPGVIHRDIKPANILLAEPAVPGVGETAKLTDFGIARLVDDTRMTMTGFALGTANYLSPEQVRGQHVAAPTDIYSLGLVLLECLTGVVAYPGHGVEPALARLNRQPVIPESVPPGWARLLAAMTDRLPEARPTAAQIGAELPTLGIESPTTRVLPVGDAAANPRRRRRLLPWAIAATGLALALAVVIGVLTSSGGGIEMQSQPAYPRVSGQLGGDVRHLELDVADSNTTLQADTLALARAAEAKRWPAVDAAASRLRTDLAAAVATDQLGAAQAAAVRTDLAAIASDLAAKSTSPTPTPAASTTPTQHAPPPPPKPQPPKHGHHGKGGGNGQGGHGGEGGGGGEGDG